MSPSSAGLPLATGPRVDPVASGWQLLTAPSR